MNGLALDTRLLIRAGRNGLGPLSLAILTLAVGVAAVTTVFSVVSSILFRPLPYKNSNRLVAISERGWASDAFSRVSLQALDLLRREAQTLEGSGAFRERVFSVKTDSFSTREVIGAEIDEKVFPLLGIRPQMGREFSNTDILAGLAVTILSDSLWRDFFGSRQSLQGASVRIGGVVHDVVGVMPKGVHFSQRSALWIPLRPTLASDTSDEAGVAVVARIRDGVDRKTVASELLLIAGRLPQSTGGASTLILRSSAVDRGGSRILPFLGPLGAAGAVVLLVACVNVGNLLLSRAAARRGTIAIQLAIGAPRGRLLRLLLIEGIIVAALSTTVALWLSALLLRAALSLVPTYGFPGWLVFALDTRILAFGAAVGTVTIVLTNIGPALATTAILPIEAMKNIAKDTTHSSRQRRKSGLIVLQIVGAVSLGIAAALLLRSQRNIYTVDPGIPADSIYRFSVALNAESNVARNEAMYYRRVAERLARSTDVASTSLVDTFGGWLDSNRTPSPSRTAGRTSGSLVSLRARDGDWLPLAVDGRIEVWDDDAAGTLGLQIAGRSFSPADQSSGKKVVIVSQQVARALPRPAIGQQLQIGGSAVEVVGVAPDIRVPRTSSGRFSAPTGKLYVSAHQALGVRPQLLIRVRQPSKSLFRVITEAAHDVDPNVRVMPLRTLAEEIRLHAVLPRVMGFFFLVCALMALVFAVVGVYAIVAYSITQRTSELGIRIALGASARQIVLLAFQDTLQSCVQGLAIGIPLAIGFGILIRGMLWGISPLDPATIGVTALLIAGACLTGAIAPALRATRISPTHAIRGG
jgi:putative ABC transport system permease protein